MPFTTPLALLGLLFIPAIVAMYLLKLRRDEAIVPSTLLWSRLLTDVEANAPWQRLRRSLLLLLQLLLVVILAFLAARPFLERPAGLAHDVVIIIDTSASMSATDILPNRLEAAKAAAIDALRELPTGGKVSVITADRTARIVANETSDLGRVRQAIASIAPTASTGDLGDALELASKLARRSGDAQILVATDAALARSPSAVLDAPVTVLQVGRDRRNQAIVALAVRTAPSGLTQSAFITVANLDLAMADRRIEVYGDGALIEARDVVLDPQTRTDIVVDDITNGGERHVDVIEVRLTGGDGATPGADPDLLALDDRAWAIVPQLRTRLVLLVSDGEPYLETALSHLPNVELYGVRPSEYGPRTERTDGRPWDLVIFDGTIPGTLPQTPILAIAPPRSSPLGDVVGILRDPGIGTLEPDEPILRFVDLSTTHIAQAQRLVLPEWARVVIPGPRGAPLLYSGSRDGLPTAVLAFEPRRSDLPLQIAFPILIANLSGELLGGSAAPADAVAPGAPVPLVIPQGASALRVERPDGSTVDLIPSAAGGAAVTFSSTDLVGIYTATPVFPSETSPDPTAAASPAGTTSPGATVAPTDPATPIRFAVALFDVDESTIAPGSAAAIERLGTVPSPDPGASPRRGDSAPDPRATTRDELWAPLILLVLVFLAVEWAVFHRDALVRVRRALAVRRGRQPSGSDA